MTGSKSSQAFDVLLRPRFTPRVLVLAELVAGVKGVAVEPDVDGSAVEAGVDGSAVEEGVEDGDAVVEAVAGVVQLGGGMSSRVVVELGLGGITAPCDGILGVGVDNQGQVHSPAPDGESPILGGAPLGNAVSLSDESAPNRRVLALSKDSSVGSRPDIEPTTTCRCHNGVDSENPRSSPRQIRPRGSTTARVGAPGRSSRAGQLFDGMPPKVTKRWVPVNRAEGAASFGGRGGVTPAVDRRSALPVAPRQQRLVQSKATTGTKRWVPVNRGGGTPSGSGGGDPDSDRLSALPDALLHHVMSFLKAWEDDYDEAPEDFPGFVRQLFRRRDASASLDTLRVRSSNVDGAHGEDHAKSWIRTAIKRGARVIHLVGHRRVHFLMGRGSSLAVLDHTAFVSSQLKVLKLSYALLDDNMLGQLSSQCPSLEELDLMDCVIIGHEISSASLKILTMFKCKINVNLSIASPNLVLLRCVSPITQAPSFKDMGSLVTGTIILDDRAFYEDDFEDFSKDELEETTDEDDNDSYWKDKNRYGFGLPLKGYGLGYKDNYGFGSDIESDDNTYEYSEIANSCGECSSDGYDHSSSKNGKHNVCSENSGSNDNKVLGGHNVLQSLSNAISLELLADAGEIKCSKDDARVHKVAHLFKANGVPVEKIFVRRTGSTYLWGEKMMKDLARQELEFWGDDEFWESVEFCGYNEFCEDSEFSEDDEFWGYG
ncbi:hypothetical protein PR202_ga27498 [Eleusine coracana subsp. coracana]|uniref:Uncharacterized protein n=1 Tax=Eleusine coracana subsp. coracana TaxID=191504 RepID=A0AAV5DH38_ELECO|nr:hypothetical protein PR202_ga27498 [Eleusine coracana subsp. coracana]